MRQRKGKRVEEKTKFRLVPLDEPADPVDFYGMIVDDDDMDEDYKCVLLDYLMAATHKTRSKNDDEMDEYDEEHMLSYQMAVANKRQRRNDDEMDDDFNHYLLKYQRTAANKKRRHIDDDEEEEEDDDSCHEELNDPDYELFLENLKEHEQSYLLDFEGKENGLIVRVCIKYEEESNPDREGNLEPRRKLKSAARQMNGDSDQILCLENRRKHASQSQEKINSDKECGLEPRRRLRSAAKKINRDSNQILCVENYRKHGSESEENLNADKEWGEPRRKLRSDVKQINRDSDQILCLENRRKHGSESEEKLNSDEEWGEPRRKLRSAAKQINRDSDQDLCLENRRKHASQSEEKINSDKECGLEPRRRLRSAAKQINRDSDQILCSENHQKHASQSEEKINSDKGNLEPRRKLRSAAKQINGDSTQTLGLENNQKGNSLSTPAKAIVKLPQRQLGNKTSSEKGNYIKLSKLEGVEEVEDDFLTWMHKNDSQSEELNSDKGWSLEPRRKLRSAAKQINGDSPQILGLENHLKGNSRSTPTKVIMKPPEGKLGNKTDSKKGVKLSMMLEDEDGVDGDFLTWMQGVEALGDDYYVFKSGGYFVEYNKKDLECNLVNEEYNDESSTDVEFLGSRFNKDENPDFSTIIEGNASGKDDVARFRRKVIAALRKPYSQQEYDELLQAVEFRKPEERHLDLRHGRERSYSVQKEGKSYLDYYPDFERKLLQATDDKPRCLNLLRGFFIWLKQPGMLAPWKDAELLAIKPCSG